MKLFPSRRAARIGTLILLPGMSGARCAGMCSRFRRFQSMNCWRSDIKNFAGSAFLREAKAQPLQRALDVILCNWRTSAIFRWLIACVAVTLARAGAASSEFRFDRDTLAFQNATVLKYKNGVPFLRARSTSDDPANKYTRCCFVMTRTVMQFRKFARFDPAGIPLDDNQLRARIRAVSRHFAWQEPLPENERIVFPGYANLRQMSNARAEVFKENIGSGFITYFRPSNGRMFFQHSRKYQDRTHRSEERRVGKE